MRTKFFKKMIRMGKRAILVEGMNGLLGYSNDF